MRLESTKGDLTVTDSGSFKPIEHYLFIPNNKLDSSVNSIKINLFYLKITILNNYI